LNLRHSGWRVCIEAVPSHGYARKEFFRDELERWSSGNWCGAGCFGTGFKDVGIIHDGYRIAASGGFRMVGDAPGEGNGGEESVEHVPLSSWKGSKEVELLTMDVERLREYLTVVDRQLASMPVLGHETFL
jgi:hypothetical protein